MTSTSPSSFPIERGVVAAGHPLTAEAGAWALREGGNAVDAAISAVMASFAVESPLTGLGAGGYMTVHDPRGRARPDAGGFPTATGPGPATVLIDFFVAASGRGGQERGSDLIPVDVHFDANTIQRFNVGAASCGVPGAPAGLAHAHRRFATMPLRELARPGIRLAREGTPLNAQQAYVLRILSEIYTAQEAGRQIYAPAGRILGQGELLRIPQLADDLECFAAEGAEPFYRGELAAAISELVMSQGGTLSPEDLAAYDSIEREPAQATFLGHQVLTNPPPSSGGILVAFCLELLDRLAAVSPTAPGGPTLADIVTVMRAANEARDPAFIASLAQGSDFLAGFLSPARLDRVAAHLTGGDRLGSTTHLVAVDADGMCASVTCSNGTGSGVIVPGTAIHLNNMMGEQDLNPLGFHRASPGTRMPSMMAPTVVLRDGELVAGLGSAGSNRIRSAILQTVIGLVGHGMGPSEAVEAPRVHFEEGVLQAEPGIADELLRELEAAGVAVTRWDHLNLFFGGVQAVARAADGSWTGAGDPRRGGAVAIA